ncbi:hypothetical protein L0B53_15790 [Vibrio sp. SS-MA-C1-2]|nr:hypothetical protein L0B53_15790 [Vibrio sp. SS-MA-C1-2]
MKIQTLLLLSFFSTMTVAQDSLFPIWGDEAEKRGYTLPKPYGLSFSYMDINDSITVNSHQAKRQPSFRIIKYRR